MASRNSSGKQERSPTGNPYPVRGDITRKIVENIKDSVTSTFRKGKSQSGGAEGSELGAGGSSAAPRGGGNTYGHGSG